jgi:tetratricopeptide (TPR) repeat protein
MNKIPEAITQLVALLDVSPTDAEGWSELSDLYLSQNLIEQSIYCLEEVLLLNPNAWNVCHLVF